MTTEQTFVGPPDIFAGDPEQYLTIIRLRVEKMSDSHT